MAPSLRPLNQKQWLAEKFKLYTYHHDTKTLKQFFPSVYEEYFAKWPPTPTAELIDAANGDHAVATVRLRGKEEEKIYRWMYNRLRTKHGVTGEGSPANLNLTAGPPKKKAAVQMYVKKYWETKVKQEVINKWAPTPETDLFDEADIGEDQVGWEALTPMEKNIPLWFRMEVGRKLYEAESDEVKAEIDRLRDEEKEGAIVANTPVTTFKTEEERLTAMKKFDDNFPKLAHSLQNLCTNVMRDFGFHTSIIVGGPVVRDDGRLRAFNYESHGSVHKQLTFSEFLGQSYESEVSEKFIEYLQHCSPKPDRQLYTLNSITAMEKTPPPSCNVSTAAASKSPLAAHASGPARTERKSTQARMRTGPMSPALKARVLANISNRTSEVSETPANVAVVSPVEVEPTGQVERVSSQPPEDIPDSTSPTSALPELLDDGMDDSVPPATDEMIVDDEAPPATTSNAPYDSVIEVQTFPALGTTGLVETSQPALLFVDEDERPHWLLTSINKFLRHVPYYMCLGEVVDLFLAQEERLGYPVKSARTALPCGSRPDEVAAYMKHARDFTCGDEVDAKKFGAQVTKWWITIQPTTRKEWPPTYKPLPKDFSFDYFNRGGPNGVFLMILCISWWANALTPDMDHTAFKLVVHDVRWVLEQVANRV